MSVKTKVLQVLESNRNRPVSGQELADTLGVTRTAVWKAVKSLQEEGYTISAVTKVGYCLEAENDILSAEAIRLHLPGKLRTLPIEVLKTVDSTNSYAKKRMIDGASHGTIILSEEQTKGRGRYGKSFFSPAGTGIYLSLILKPEQNLRQVLPITIAAAVAVTRVVENYTDTAVTIKWVNDIYADGKKICGILTEAMTDFESGMVEGVVLGIGVNIKTEPEAFPEDLKGLAGSLFPREITRNQIVAEIITEFLKLYRRLDSPKLVEEYKSRSCVIGEKVAWIRGERLCEGIAEDIDGAGNLVIRMQDGTRHLLNAGEISIRKS